MSVATDSGGPSFADGVNLIMVPAATPEPAGLLLGGVPAFVGGGALWRRRLRPGQALPFDQVRVA